MPTSTQPDIELSPWKAFKQTFASVMNTIVAISRTTEKTVGLVENEIDHLDTEQQIRLDAIKAEREAAIA